MGATAAKSIKSSKRVLEPSERIAEILFGLIMVLTFTGSLSIAEAGKEGVRTMLVGALGCSLAWGVIDGLLYLMGSLAEKERGFRTYTAIRRAGSPEHAHALIADALPPVIAESLQADQLERIRQHLLTLPAAPGRAGLEAADWRGAVGIFLLVFLSTVPVAVPFMLMQDATRALRVSNLVAVAMLFGCGSAYGRAVDRSPWLVGVAMIGLGVALVSLTMALGG